MRTYYDELFTCTLTPLKLKNILLIRCRKNGVIYWIAKTNTKGLAEEGCWTDRVKVWFLRSNILSILYPEVRTRYHLKTSMGVYESFGAKKPYFFICLTLIENND